MSKTKKIAIENFMTEKQLKKIDKIIDKKLSVAEAADKLEELFDGTHFKPLDGGTNRYIWTSKKLKGYVFKIAEDRHGIEANYREFYNGDISKYLTQSYAISENGTVLVQEKVERIRTWEEALKHKKAIIKMLWKLHKKILLVDCSFTKRTFKNFGLRDGELVLLDHGDTVPFEDFQEDEVNFNEEINVSLRCRAVIGSKNDKKQCKGLLVPNDDFSLLICDTCGKQHKFHDAYKEFIIDEIKRRKKGPLRTAEIWDIHVEEDEKIVAERELEECRMKRVKEYCKKAMEGAGNMGKKEMKDSYQVFDGYVVPTETSIKFAGLRLNKLRRGEISPEEYLEFIGENPDEWREEDFLTISEIENMADNELDDDEEYDTIEKHKNLNDIEDKYSYGLRDHDNDDDNDEDPEYLEEVDPNEIDEDGDEEEQSLENNINNNQIVHNIVETVTDYAKKNTWTFDNQELSKEIEQGYATDGELFNLISGGGSKIPKMNINLLRFIFRNTQEKNEFFAEIDMDPKFGESLYQLIIRMAVAREEEFASEKLLFTDLASFQNDIWSALHKSYKRSNMPNRNYACDEFSTAFERNIATLEKYILFNDITEDGFKKLTKAKNVHFTDADITNLFHPAKMDEATIEAQDVKADETNKTNKIDQSALLEVMDEAVEAFGMGNIIEYIMMNDKYIKMMESKVSTAEDFASCANKENILTSTLATLKGKTIAVSIDDKKDTIVVLDLYEHLIRKINEIPKDKVSMIRTVTIGEFEEYDDYDKYYNE